MPLDELNRLIAEAGALPDDKTSHRYNLIRRMAKLYAEKSFKKIATRMARDLNNYQQARWQRDQHKAGAEVDYREGEKSRVMFQIMKATDGKPPGNWRIEEILSGRKCGP